MQEYADVYQEMFQFTQNVVFRRGVRLRDVEDVAHDVMLTLLEKWPEYDQTRPLEPYLYTIAVRRVTDYHERKREELFGGGTELLHVEDPRWLPQDQQCIIKQELQQATECIDDTLIQHITGEPVAKLSRDPGAPPLDTLYSRLRRQRQRVRTKLKKANGVFTPGPGTEAAGIILRWQKWGERWMRSLFSSKRQYLPNETIAALGAEFRRVKAKARRHLAVAYMRGALSTLAPRHLRTVTNCKDPELAELASRMLNSNETK